MPRPPLLVSVSVCLHLGLRRPDVGRVKSLRSEPPQLPLRAKRVRDLRGVTRVPHEQLAALREAETPSLLLPPAVSILARPRRQQRAARLHTVGDGRSPGGLVGLQFLCRLGPLGTGLGAALAVLCAGLLRFASSYCAGPSRASAGGDSPRPEVAKCVHAMGPVGM